MITDLLYLWRHRERPANLSRWLVLCVKRSMLAVALLRILFRAHKLAWKGANMGALVSVGKAKIDGNFQKLTVGDFSSIGRCEIALHDCVSIGKSVVINDGAILLTASHHLNDVHWRHKKGPILLDDYVWIATNAIICPGVSIGVGAVVGAGAVVRQDVAPYSIVIGNPAQVLTHRRAENLVYRPTLMNAPLEAWVGRNLQRIPPD